MDVNWQTVISLRWVEKIRYKSEVHVNLTAWLET